MFKEHKNKSVETAKNVHWVTNANQSLTQNYVSFAQSMCYIMLNFFNKNVVKC